MSYEKNELIIKCNVPIYTLWTDLMCYKEKKYKLIIKCNVPIYTLWTDLMCYKEKFIKTLSNQLFNDCF